MKDCLDVSRPTVGSHRGFVSSPELELFQDAA